MGVGGRGRATPSGALAQPQACRREATKHASSKGAAEHTGRAALGKSFSAPQFAHLSNRLMLAASEGAW